MPYLIYYVAYEQSNQFQIMRQDKDTGKSPQKRNPNEGIGFNLYDNIILDIHQKELEKNLKGFKEAEKLYEELVAEGKEKIDIQFHERRRALETKDKINKSSLINLHHMKKAELRFKMCQEVFRAVLQRINTKIQGNEQQYCLILIKFIVEGALRMFEPELKIKCLARDVAIVEKVLGDAQETFNSIMEEQTGRMYPIKLKINPTDVLSQRDLGLKDEEFNKNKEDQLCIGGVILTDPTGDITYKNTIDTRVNILKEISLPTIRAMLWPSLNQTTKDDKQA